ncbi:TetR/AcrR family transcriptional regulator [Nesterenkonia pannonica]|uniref:TetR/AcrR family transcriptional regulator n=1 Tax=Nesterenkonia pannonica TaxID=1548602 RepID=UPI0021641265|nr:TetR/AcrR family transcriptional regulator [Nesterenkonia pannonica]
MRQSKREQALEAATRVVQRDGVTALSYEAVAAEAGLTKGGLVYHFPSREALLRALHEHVSGGWERYMAQQVSDDANPARPEELDAQSRLDAYVRGSASPAGNPDRAELQLMLQATEDPESQAIWNAVHERWAPPLPEESDDRAVDMFLARLASDGLWLYEALTDEQLEPALRETLLARIIQRGRGEAGS